MPNPKVGDIIKVSSSFTGPSGPMSIGAYPVRWDSVPADAAMPDPLTFPKGDGVSTLGYMNFVCVKSGMVNFRFQKVGDPALHVGTNLQIDPLPPITAQSANFEGIIP